MRVYIWYTYIYNTKCNDLRKETPVPIPYKDFTTHINKLKQPVSYDNNIYRWRLT